MARTTTIRTNEDMNDSDRLALLWRAFEEAEQRIAELERDLDRTRRAPSRDAPRAAPPDETHELKERLRESHERETALIAQLTEARKLADAEAQRYLAATGVIRHEAERARHAELEREVATRALHEARIRASLAHVAQVDLATERGSLQARNERLEAELANERHEVQIAQTRLALADVKHEVEMAEREHASLLDQATTWGAMHEENAHLRRELAAEREEVRRVEARLAEVVVEREAEHAARIAPATPVAAPRPSIQPARLFPVLDGRVGIVPGIRPNEVDGLRHAGVNMADALLYADIAALSATAEIGIPRLSRLRSLAELMALDGIGPEWAERLYRAGARGIMDVAIMSAEELTHTLLRSYDEERPSDEARALLERTIPARAEAVVAQARAAVVRW